MIRQRLSKMVDFLWMFWVLEEYHHWLKSGCVVAGMAWFAELLTTLSGKVCISVL
jgi:hypothetical protein